ncbi:pseudouridine synthase [Limisphaera ngatamarikiensis]|uniref:Pseudouridine synthase n=1 Tax=Limisphaera ngatamarikiensis TaxID=1324935 RepID=A0A6M1RV67_9BACT|nr:pseudouridine synthase [Limisphaera ngatamarikiensis]NGO38652.1 pseudouridine synthase [Limisphaera ngatamarikiensis]
MLIAFHKPCGVLSQFTPDHPGQLTLAQFGFPPRVYPIGRLDADSEGLLLLSDEPALTARILDPRHAHPREYWVQIERIPTPETLRQLERGVRIGNHLTRPCRARFLEPPPQILPPEADPAQHPIALGPQPPFILPARNPPVRYRKTVPDCWIALELHEGKNRQVRRMTAAVGHPTLRLIRVRIGQFWLGSLPPGHWRILTPAERQAVLARP